MTLENQALHLQITELEAQLAEARAEVERAGRDYDELIAQQSKFGELFQQANNGQPLTIDQIRQILVDSVISTDAEVNAIKAERDRMRNVLESIQYTLRQGFGDQYMLNRIKHLVDDAIDGHALENAVVTSSDGEVEL